MKTIDVSERKRVSGQVDISSQLSALDLARFLRELSALHSNTQTGNPALSAALRELAKTIQRNSSVPLADLLRGINYSPATRKPRMKSPSSALVGLELSSMELAHIRRLLSEEHLTKEDLILIASARFGIPSSGLRRQAISAVLDEIDTAFKNEESLTIISREANRQGHLRST